MRQRKQYSFRETGKGVIWTQFQATDERGRTFDLTVDKAHAIIRCECPAYQADMVECTHTAALRRHLNATCPKSYNARVLANPRKVVISGGIAR